VIYLAYLIRNILFILIGTLIAFLTFTYVAPLLSPFIVAVFLSFFIEPLVTYFQTKHGWSRGAAVGTAMLIVFGGFTLAITLAVTRLIVELFHLTAYLPNYIESIKTVVISMQNKLQAFYFTLPADVLDFINKKSAGSAYSLDSILGKVQVIAGKLLDFVLALVSSVPAWIILIIISAIATYFMSKDKNIIIGQWLRIIPPPWGRKTLDIIKDIFAAIIGYLRAQLVLISITFAQTLVGLYIIGAPYALLMGLVIGIADLLPILGPSAIYLPWIAWSFITGDTVFAIKLTVLFVVVLINRQVLETKIMSSTMGMHPLATLIAMYMGLQLMGPIGVIAGPMFIIVVKSFATAGIIGWKQD
jgi:sporulation integral membrane protein YtvI